MNKVLKKYYLLMLIFLIPNSLILLSTTVRTNYSITAPGGASLVDERFEIENGYTSSNLYSLYVYSLENSTYFQNFVANLMNFTVSEISESFSHMTDEMWALSGQIQKQQSIEASLINAYYYASLTDESISIDYTYTGCIIYYNTADDTVFEIGDIITHINGEKLTSKNDFSIEYGDSITYIRDDVEVEITIADNDQVGIALYDKFDITSSTPSYTIEESNTSGPSAGMMQTLSIYNQLVEQDITIKDGVQLNIAGTGTIETDGSIGAIGGVDQKVTSAYLAGADVLIMSKENEDDAINAYNKLGNVSMELLIVETFEDVLKWLS